MDFFTPSERFLDMKVLKLGILGAGRIGKIHCENALRLPDAQVLAICDPYLDQFWVLDKPIKHKLTNEEEFFKINFDAVIISSPSKEHINQVKKAIFYQKHIFCEKPLSSSLEEHNSIKKELENSPLKFQIGFNRRFDGDFLKIYKYIKEDKNNMLFYIRITSRDPELPSYDYLSKSGGMFFDMTIHDFDMARYIMNSEITEVYAQGSCLIYEKLKEYDDIDTGLITLKFANNAFGVIDNSRKAVYGYDQRIEVFGSKGSISNINHHETSIISSSKEGFASDAYLNFFLDRYSDSYRLELECFVNSCLEDNKATPGIDDAIKAIKIAHAAKVSLIHNIPVLIKT